MPSLSSRPAPPSRPAAAVSLGLFARHACTFGIWEERAVIRHGHSLRLRICLNACELIKHLMAAGKPQDLPEGKTMIKKTKIEGKWTS